MNKRLSVSMIAWMALSHSVPAQVPVVARPSIFIDVGNSFQVSGGGTLCLIGTPLDIGITVANSRVVERAAHQLEATRMECSEAIREGRVPNVAPSALASEDVIRLPQQGAGWADSVSIELLRRNDDGTLVNSPEMGMAVFHEALLAGRQGSPPEPALTGDPVSARLVIAPEIAADISSGTYVLRVRYDTRQSAESLAWKGLSEQISAPITFRAAESSREIMSLKMSLAVYYQHHRAFSQAASQAQGVLDIDPSFQEYRAFDLAGDARLGLGDYAGAVASWQQYLDGVGPDSDTRAVRNVKIKMFKAAKLVHGH